jgi:hypothetical protein
MCRWLSTNPGMTIMPEASITSTSPFARLGPTATIRSPSIRTSASANSPTLGSRLRTVPPRMSIRVVGTTLKSGPAG